MKRILTKIFSRNFIFIAMLLLQIAFIAFTIWKLREHYFIIHVSIMVLNIVLIVYIINKNENPAYKLAWIIAIDILPLFAGLAYLFIQTQLGKKLFIKLQDRSIEYSKNFLMQNQDTLSHLEIESKKVSNLSTYINQFGPYPVYTKTTVQYFPVGELQFEALINELKKAEHFIFMEFFIIAYIPTNVISITDGQIFLETDLFNAGVRPAVNPGISVSRVGSAAQIKAMKKVSGSLKLSYSQYRELQSFSQFGSDLDKDTKERLAKGERIVEVLKQDRNKPVAVENQVIIIYAVTHNYLSTIPVKLISDYQEALFEYVDTSYPEITDSIRDTKDLTPETEERLKEALTAFAEKYMADKK